MYERQLRRAVEAEVVAFQPEHRPPFEHVLARKRARDRRVAAAAAAAGAVVVAVAGTAVVVALVMPAASDGRDRLASDAPPAPSAAGPAATPDEAGPRKLYVLRYADAAAYEDYRTAVDDCLGLPGVGDVRQSSNVPPVVSAIVSGEGQNAAFASCVAELDGVTVVSESERVWKDAPWVVEEVSDDRRSVTVRAYGIAAGCTGPGRGAAQNTSEGVRLRVELDVPVDEDTPCRGSLPMVRVTVELPRPLEPGEAVLGQCIPNDETVEGKQCRDVRSFAALPEPGAD